jgi:hypothetical protein
MRKSLMNETFATRSALTWHDYCNYFLSSYNIYILQRWKKR